MINAAEIAGRLAYAARLAIGGHRLLAASVQELDAAGVMATPAAEAEIAELIEDSGDWADALNDLAEGRPQRRHADDGLQYTFAERVAAEWRERRPPPSPRRAA